MMVTVQSARWPLLKWGQDFLVDRRVALTSAIFLALVLHNLLLGSTPRNLFHLRERHVAAGLALVGCGLALRSWAAGTLRKGKALTTAGPYRLCQHPLYLGSLLLMPGFCLLVRHVHDAFLALGCVMVLYLLTMQREERRLAERYGDAWAAYARRTPHLVPRRFGADAPQMGPLWGQWSLAQWVRSREYKAFLATLAGLAALQIWHACLPVLTGQ
jgi:protein-S-isoprenylcysteine O-methyltransferase Ste14